MELRAQVHVTCEVLAEGFGGCAEGKCAQGGSVRVFWSDVMNSIHLVSSYLLSETTKKKTHSPSVLVGFHLFIDFEFYVFKCPDKNLSYVTAFLFF